MILRNAVETQGSLGSDRGSCPELLDPASVDLDDQMTDPCASRWTDSTASWGRSLRQAEHGAGRRSNQYVRYLTSYFSWTSRSLDVRRYVFGGHTRYVVAVHVHRHRLSEAAISTDRLRLRCARRTRHRRSRRRSHQRSRRSPTTSSNSFDRTPCASASSYTSCVFWAVPSAHHRYYGRHARSSHVSFVTLAALESRDAQAPGPRPRTRVGPRFFGHHRLPTVGRSRIDRSSAA